MIPALLDRLGHIPVIGPTLNRFADADISDTLREILSTSGDYLMRVSQKSLGNISAAVLNFLIVLLLVFFFLVDGKKMVRRIYETVPVSNREIDQIVAETFSTTSATLISTIIIGILEGALATVLFVVFGLPSPFFWGVVTVVLSMIPLIGSNLIIIPAGLTVVLGGRPLAGLFIVLAGVVGVALTQNVVKPKLLGDRTGLHPALALLATLGGIAWLGLIGFLVGPVVASVFIVVWRQFARRYQRLLQDKDSAPE
jgi:predicted PurR-regulated permease PerM